MNLTLIRAEESANEYTAEVGGVQIHVNEIHDASLAEAFGGRWTAAFNLGGGREGFRAADTLYSARLYAEVERNNETLARDPVATLRAIRAQLKSGRDVMALTDRALANTLK